MWEILLLFVLVILATRLMKYRIEHLTVQEVDDKTTKALTKIDTLEGEYKQLHARIDKQESKMGAASTQAAQAQALMPSFD